MFTGVEDLGHSASAVHPEDCSLVPRDLKSHSSLYFNEAQRCPFISFNNELMLLEMQQETSGRVRGSGQAVSCPVQFGLDAGKGKKQTDLSAFSWGGEKKK